MKSLFSRHYSLLLLLMALAFIFSCSSEDKKAEEIRETETLSVEEKEMQLIHQGLQQLPSWIAHWKNIAPDFDPEDFSFTRGYVYDKLEWPEENTIKPGSEFYPYLIYHPEQEGVIDLYSYKVAYGENGKPYFNPDSEVIYFKSDGMRERLMFMGPSGAFEEAVWVSPDHLLVAGNFEEEEGIRPMLWLIFPEENRYLLFENPVASKTQVREDYLKKKLNKIDF